MKNKQKTIEDEVEKQVKTFENNVEKKCLDINQKPFLFSKHFLNEEATYELSKIVEMENKLERNHLIYKTGNRKNDKTYDF